MAVLALSQPKESPITAIREAIGKMSTGKKTMEGPLCDRQAVQPALQGLANGLQSFSEKRIQS